MVTAFLLRSTKNAFKSSFNKYVNKFKLEMTIVYKATELAGNYLHINIFH